MRRVERVQIARVPSTALCMCTSEKNVQNNITFDTFLFLSYEAQIQKLQVKTEEGKVHGDSP